jgi:hypothetical protein
MKKLPKLLINLPFGIFIGATISLILAWSIDNEAALNISRMKVYVFGSVLTMIAAIITVAGVLSNLDFQRDQVEEARKRKAQSARAFLPNALSIFIERAVVGLHFNFRLLPTGQILDLKGITDLTELALPDETVVVFRDLIEHSNNEVLRNHLFELLREHQVLVARSKSSGGHGTFLATDENYRHVVHWAYLITLTSVIFDYARGETETMETTIVERDIQGQLHVNGLLLSPQEYARYHQHISLYASKIL